MYIKVWCAKLIKQSSPYIAVSNELFGAENAFQSRNVYVYFKTMIPLL